MQHYSFLYLGISFFFFTFLLFLCLLLQYYQFLFSFAAFLCDSVAIIQCALIHIDLACICFGMELFLWSYQLWEM